MISYFCNLLYAKQRYCKSSFILCTTLLLSGCGFHLKHVDGLADKYPQLYLQTHEPNGDLARFVKVRLRGAGIELVPNPDANIATLKIDSERRSSRTISLYVNAQNAEQEISYNLNYSIQTPGYQAQEFSVNLYRDFLDNSAKALAKSRESERLLKTT
ncbi:LPS assembly lipoprotein LptE [Psychromonas sp. MME1]|uniref:LPS-assembly lipoprotein LptE n=1 Tax=Psychromonas sp. MME1 TaxID=3231032 RepID=UPI0034E1EA2B